jgi:hypothetical protein
MSTLLPIGEEAAAARLREADSYVQSVEQALPAAVPDEIRAMLAQVRDQPLDEARWTALKVLLRVAVRRGYDTGAHTQWERPLDRVRSGWYTARMMNKLARAGAPICDDHGPMADSADPAVQQSHDGHRWHCVDDADCKSDYWWVDGTHLRRRRPGS